MSTRIAVSTVRRHVTPEERSGFLRVIDLASRRKLLEAPVPESLHRAIDPNPRGGYRGAKGLSVHGDRLAAANSERVFVFDRSWALSADLTHPRMGSVHDVLAEENAIWITCTNCDLLLELGWDGTPRSSWTWRRDSELARVLGYRHPPRLDEECDYRDPRSTKGRLLSLVQLNAVARHQGRLLVSFGRVLPRRAYLRKRVATALERLGLGVRSRNGARSRSTGTLPTASEPHSTFAVIAVGDAGKSEVVYRVAGVAVPNHNLLSTGDRLLFNDTHGGRLVEIDLEEGLETRSALVPGSPSFARGLARLDDNVFLVGSQRPAAVHVLDLEDNRVVDTFALSEDPRESVYAIAVLPDSFDDPPPRLDFQVAQP